MATNHSSAQNQVNALRQAKLDFPGFQLQVQPGSLCLFLIASKDGNTFIFQAMPLTGNKFAFLPA